MCGFLGKKDYVTEDEISDQNEKKVATLVSGLKQILSLYWDL
jgi:hypothetical protein